MPDERDARPVAKLVLLQQACCDSRLDSSAKGALAVILDACHGSHRCFVGPTAIARTAGFNEKTIREGIKALAAAGYVWTEARTKRSNWIYPNFPHAERSGCLVDRDSADSMRVHRPASNAGLQARYGSKPRVTIAGVHVPDSGCARPRKRVWAPDEAVEETIEEAVGPSASLEEQEQQRQQEKREQVRAQYLRARETDPVLVRIMEREGNFRKHIEDLIGVANLGSDGEAIDAAA